MTLLMVISCVCASLLETGDNAERAQASTCGHAICRGPLQLQLRGGRAKRDQVDCNEENEKLAREYLAKVRGKGKAIHNDIDDRADTVGVPEQVADEETESKRRSMVSILSQ